MAALETYLQAVAKRKAIDRRGPSPCVNYAVLVQLEEHDVPLLTEIIRVQADALEELETGQDEEARGIALRANVRVSELAGQGSTAHWGDYRKDNGHG